MNILVIGSGGREYSIGQKLKSENNVNKIYFSPGNGATARLGQNIEFSDFDKLAKFAIQNKIDLTIVGPEAPLSSGIVDTFKKYNLTIFGPTKSAARLESSKAYMKDFLAKNSILTAKYINSDNYEEISNFIDTMGEKVVIKADGLCAGKGVIIANNHKEAKEAARDMLSGDSFGDAGKRVVVEEYLDGFELSFFAICDGENYVLLPVAQDHKRLLDDDKGPNTGGMGAYAPSPLATSSIIKKVENDVIKPTLKGMKQDDNEFCGVLFVGIMVVGDLPYVLEFNVRFGDPECEAIMPLIKGKLSELLYNASTGKLEEIKLEDKFAVAVVISSENYPYSSSKPELIQIKKIPHNSHIAYAGVSAINSDLYADGGRVLVCVGVGNTIKEARDKAYELCENVKFKGMHYRKDIAYQALK